LGQRWFALTKQHKKSFIFFAHASKQHILCKKQVATVFTAMKASLSILAMMMMAMSFTVVVATKKRAYAVFRAPTGFKPDNDVLPTAQWRSLDVILTVARNEFLAEGGFSTNSTSDIIDTPPPSGGDDTDTGNNQTRALLRGRSSTSNDIEDDDEQRQLAAACPPPRMSCRSCVRLPETVVPEYMCDVCGNCDRRARRSLLSQLSLWSGFRGDTPVAPNPMANFTSCHKVNASSVQADISEVAEEMGVTRFTAGFKTTTVRVYICED
jgi:hypothetical protein